MIELNRAVDAFMKIQHDPEWIAFREPPPGYQKTQLENGIRVITESVPEMRSVAIGILFDAGPCDEVPSQKGLAHLTEHLMFQGTSSRDSAQIAQLMDIGGGNMGAFTSRDYVCFFATILDDYCTYALDLLGDVLLNSVFQAKSVEREKSAILREMDVSHDTPFERVASQLKSFAWQGHPLGEPVIGLPETVKSLTREDVIYFAHENLTPDRMIVAAAGNIEHRDFVAQVRDAFWRMLGQGSTKVSSPPMMRAGVVTETMPVSQAYFSIGIPALTYTHPDRYALHILNTIIGGGSSSRLFRRIRDERGLVYSINSEYVAYRDAGMIVIEGSTAPDHLLEVLELVFTELHDLAGVNDPIDDEELWKAKMQICGRHLIASENTNTRMSRLATQELYFERFISAEEIVASIETVNSNVIQRLAQENLTEALRRIAVAVVGPEKNKANSALSIEKLLASFQ